MGPSALRHVAPTCRWPALDPIGRDLGPVPRLASPGPRGRGEAPSRGHLDHHSAQAWPPRPFRSSQRGGRLRSRELKTCLRSLLEQEAPLRILLVVPRGRWRRGGAYPTALPAWLWHMQRTTRLQVARCRDQGPGTALLRATRSLLHENTWLLAVDDDHAYHSELLTNLLRFAAGTPGSAVAAHGWLQLERKLTEMGSMSRSLRQGPPGGPILCHFLGILVQKSMLRGLRAPEATSACSEHNDIWVSAHLARQGLRRALISDPLGARSLRSHRGHSLSGRRRRRPEEQCLKELQGVSPGLWRFQRRVVLCSVWPRRWELPVQAAYSCRPGGRARRLPCGALTDQALMKEVLLREREAATVIVTLPNHSTKEVIAPLLECLEAVNGLISQAFERHRLR